MNWKIRFRELTGWRPKNDEERTKNDEERWRIFTKSLTETSRKRYGSTSAWIFSTETIFLTNFERILNTRRAEHFCSALFPLFIGEKKEVVAAQASWVASTRRHRLPLEPPGRPKWVWLLFATPFLLNTPLFALFFADSFFEMLRNFTDYVMTPIFFLECRETLRIMQQCPFWLLECCGTLRITQQCFLSTSGMLRNFTNCLTMGVKYLGVVKRRLHATKQWFPDEIRVWHYFTDGQQNFVN